MDRDYVKKHIDMCGDAVIEFMNANSTDEACLSLIPKIQSEYGFTPEFIQNAHHSFPFLDHIADDLSKWKREIISLQFLYWSELSLIERSVWNLMLLLDEYDFKNDRLIFRKELDYKKVRISLHNVNKKFSFIEKKITNSCSDKPLVENWKNTQQGYELYDHICNARKWAKLISLVNEDTSTDQESEMSRLLENELLLAHSNIQYKQLALRYIFNRTINKIRLDYFSPFTDMIDGHKKPLSKHFEILPEGNLKLMGPINRENFFTGYYKPPAEQDIDRSYFSMGADILNQYMSAIDYFMVEFITPFNNISRFHICKNCNKYFISRTKRKTKFCSKKCRQSWNNKERIKSGEHAAYKRKKRLEGAKESYYG